MQAFSLSIIDKLAVGSRVWVNFALVGSVAASLSSFFFFPPVVGPLVIKKMQLVLLL